MIPLWKIENNIFNVDQFAFLELCEACIFFMNMWPFWVQKINRIFAPSYEGRRFLAIIKLILSLFAPSYEGKSDKNDEKTSELEHRFWALAFAKSPFPPCFLMAISQLGGLSSFFEANTPSIQKKSPKKSPYKRPSP